MTLEEDYKLAKRIDELLCTEFDKTQPLLVADALKSYYSKLGSNNAFSFCMAKAQHKLYDVICDAVEHYCLTMAEKKALREFGRLDELKRIYGEDK